MTCRLCGVSGKPAWKFGFFKNQGPLRQSEGLRGAKSPALSLPPLKKGGRHTRRREGGPRCAPCAPGPPFFLCCEAKNPRALWERKGISRGFLHRGGVVGAFEGPKAGAGCALPKGRGEKRGRRAARGRGPHRRRRGSLPRRRRRGPEKKGRAEEKTAGGGGCAAAEKKAPPAGARRRRAGAVRGGVGGGGRERERAQGEAPALSPAGALAGEGRAGLWRSALGKCGAEGRPADDARQMMPGR